MKKVWGKVVTFVVTVSMAVMPAASALGADSSTTETVVETESVAEMEESAESVETEAETESVNTGMTSSVLDKSAESNVSIKEDISSGTDDNIRTGSCGDNVTYEINYTTGVLTISGEGDMRWDDTGESEFCHNNGITSVIITEGVTSIAWDAFQDCGNLISVSLPNSLAWIGQEAFLDCSSLETITIPDSVKEIRDYAFSGCLSLTSIVIPESVTEIGYRAFAGCSSLSDVTIPEHLETIPGGMFLGCNLSSFTFPKDIKRIGAGAFGGCKELSSITLLGNELTVGDNAFGNCNKLTKVHLNSIESWINIKWENKNCFASDYWDSNGGYLYIDGEELTEIEIPETVTSIGDDAFSNCIGIKEIIIPESVSYIGEFAFAGCSNLSNVVLKDGVTEIGGYSFMDCKSLRSITIPQSVIDIGTSVFVRCTNLKNVTIPDGVRNIGSDAFEDCSSLTSIIIPEGIQRIESSVFRGCSNLHDVLIPVSVKEIGYGAFDVGKGATVNVYYCGTFGQWDMIKIDKDNYFSSPINYCFEGIFLSTSQLVLQTNQKETLSYRAFIDGSAEGVSWSSNNTKVASVDTKGNVTAITYGKATITATMRINGTTYKKSCSVQTRYYDVADNSKYYFKPVYWAADKGITNGYGNVYFGTDENCTREQMITFLWRQAGKPTSKLSVCPFPDVEPDAYYYKAVLWAYEKGITKGYSSGEYAGCFGVGLPVSREDTVTFIYRMAGKPAITDKEVKVYGYPDEVSGSYYCKPIAWAAKNGITKGYTSGEYAGMFGVGLNVLRQDIVTFLYRYANLK